MNEILTYLTEKQHEMVETLRYVVEMESPSNVKEMTDQTADSIASLFEKLTGGKASIIPNDRYGNHVRGEWGSGEEQILILAHFDTVWKKGTIQSMPFRTEGDKAYGPGVFDMKGGLVQGLFALHALKTLSRMPDGKVVFLFTSDEEVGSPTSRPLIEEEASKSKCVLVLEPSMSPNGALKTSRKGVGIFNMKIHGIPSHAGVDHEKGRSAVEELARQITYLHSLTDYGTGTTVNVGLAKGGTTSNVVAAEAEAEIDLRVVTQEEVNRMLPILLSLKPRSEGTTVEITGGINRPPLERTERVARLYEIAKDLAKSQIGFDLPQASTGGASDGNFTAPLAPTLDGLGAVGDGAHAVHEHLLISEMPVRSALVALLIEQLGRKGSI
jgi:glutamate carboxypeptidase